MAIPVILNDQGVYGLVWTGQFPVNTGNNSTRASTTKTFHSYIEAYEQTAHDKGMKSYRSSRGLGTRSPHRGKVHPPNTNVANPLTYYATHGQMAASLVAAEMHRRWLNNTTNNAVFVRGQAWPLAVQGILQPNGFHYEVTMWYDARDIYVAFHCYTPRGTE